MHRTHSTSFYIRNMKYDAQFQYFDSKCGVMWLGRAHEFSGANSIYKYKTALFVPICV